MLNWRIEEEDCVKKAIEEYFKEENKNPFSFLMSDKTRRKNIQYVTDKARERYRQEKLEKYEEEIKEERKRIDRIVEYINNEFETYIKGIKEQINHKIRPFKLEVEEYDNRYSDPVSIQSLEKVTIKCEDLKIAFIQERIGEKNDKN